jgi:RNA polymerase sigma factor (sigma-70 family)
MYYPSNIEIETADKILLNYCQNLLRFDKDGAKDLKQETWIKGFVAIEKGMYCPENGKLATWLCIIAKHLFMDNKRRKQVVFYCSDFYEHQHPLMQSEPIGLDKDAKILLYNEISKLPEVQQEMLKKTYWGKLKRREIAAEKSLDLNNVGSTIFRGQQNLKKALTGKRSYFNL